MADPLLERCLEEAMKHYPKGATYTVKHGQSWEAAAYEARRKEIEPLVQAVITIVSFEVAQQMTPGGINAIGYRAASGQPGSGRPVRARKLSRCDWLVVGPEPHFAHCERCGATIPKPGLPAPFEMVIAWTEAALKMHKHCKPSVRAARHGR
jgi:hypothetical protein